MDQSGDWTASALFSPSKARAQQAQAQDWASIDSWLSKKYGSKRPPPFERNEETLRALLSLASLNDSMDEQRSYIDRIEKAALQSLIKRASQAPSSAQYMLLECLGTEEALDSLAQASIGLGSGTAEVSALAIQAVDITTSHFDLSQQAERAETLLKALKTEQSRLAQTLEELNNDDLQPPPNLLEQTSDWTKNSKHLKAKVAEYEERLTQLRSTIPGGVKLDDVVLQANNLDTLRSRLAELTADLQAYQSLPAESGAAREQLEAARDELRNLVKQRDAMFENLADVT